MASSQQQSSQGQQGLERASSVPTPLDVPGPVDPLLSQEEEEQALDKNPCPLGKACSTPLSGDDRLRTLEMFIQVQELNGNTHELGWFRPNETLGEVKKQTSQEMCVPLAALKMVSSSTVSSSVSSDSLDTDASPLGDVCRPLKKGMKINAMVQMPPEYEETLRRLDDIRFHENAYGQLVTLACEFESVTMANVNLSKRIATIIENALHSIKNPTSRGWAIAALTKLSKHLIRQSLLFDCRAADARSKDDCSDNLRSALKSINDIFEELSHSDLWVERQEADEAITKIRKATVGGAAMRGGA